MRGAAALALAALLGAGPLACGIKAPPLPPLPDEVGRGGAPATPPGPIGAPLDGGRPSAAPDGGAGPGAQGQPGVTGADGGSVEPDAGRP